jgi:hypothetical protein
MTSKNKNSIQETLSQLDELSAETYWSAGDKRAQQSKDLRSMAKNMPDWEGNKRDEHDAAGDAAYYKSNQLRRRAEIKQQQDKQTADLLKRRAEIKQQQDKQTDDLKKAGLNPAGSALLRKAGLGSAAPGPRHTPDELDESKVFRIYRNSDQSATVVMESGVAVWLAPKSVNKVLSESGNINRTKLQRLLESRIWK